MLLIGGKLVNFRNLLLSFVLYFCKDTKKNLVSQPIFLQILKLLPKYMVDIFIRRCKSDYYFIFFS